MALTLLILALALGTYLFRIAPMTLLSGVELPEWLQTWLRLVPGAVLAASLAQALLVREGSLAATWRNPFLLAAAPAFVVAWRTRNMLLTMATGMATFALVQRLLG